MTIMQTSSYTQVRKLPPSRLGALMIGEEELALVKQVLETRMLNRYVRLAEDSQEPAMAAVLEREFREWLNVPYCLAVTSGTAALEVALTAMGVGPGDEVIVPVWSWRSCYTAVVRTGALPVLAEVDGSLCLDPREIDRLVNERTKAVMVIHFQGASADIREICSTAKCHGLKVLEDCAQSMGATHQGQLIGSFGDMAIFSFQYNKVITSGEGGMVVTRDQELYERSVRIHDLGMYRPYHENLVPHQTKEFSGGQYRMSELTAAVALAQFRKLPAILEKLQRNFSRLREAVEGIGWIGTRELSDPDGDLGFEMYLVFETPDLSQQFREEMMARGVSCAPLTGTYPHYRGKYCIEGTAAHPSSDPKRFFNVWPAPGYREEDFPYTGSLVKRLVSLSMGVGHNDEDLDYIIQAFQESCEAVRKA